MFSIEDNPLESNLFNTLKINASKRGEDSILELQNAIQRIYNHEDVKPTVATVHAFERQLLFEIESILRY
jgi:hypothetical protein